MSSTKPIIAALKGALIETRLELDFTPMQGPYESLNGDDVYALTKKFEGIEALLREVNDDVRRLEADQRVTAYGLHVLELIQSPSERTAKLLRYGKSIRKCEPASA